jgi:plasmid stabilization system protein ParE
MKVSLSAEALVDAEQAADWYIDRDAWEAAQSLQKEIDQALARIAAQPGLGTPGPEQTRIFPMSLVYRVQGNVIRVIAVAAQRRQPGYWSARR